MKNLNNLELSNIINALDGRKADNLRGLQDLNRYTFTIVRGYRVDVDGFGIDVEADTPEEAVKEAINSVLGTEIVERLLDDSVINVNRLWYLRAEGQDSLIYELVFRTYDKVYRTIDSIM